MTTHVGTFIPSPAHHAGWGSEGWQGHAAWHPGSQWHHQGEWACAPSAQYQGPAGWNPGAHWHHQGEWGYAPSAQWQGPAGWNPGTIGHAGWNRGWNPSPIAHAGWNRGWNPSPIAHAGWNRGWNLGSEGHNHADWNCNPGSIGHAGWNRGWNPGSAWQGQAGWNRGAQWQGQAGWNRGWNPAAAWHAGNPQGSQIVFIPHHAEELGLSEGRYGGFSPSFATELFETNQDYVVSFDVPGIDIEDLDISLAGNTIHINGIRKGSHDASGFAYSEIARGNISRAISVPFDVSSNKSINTSLENGVLKIRIAKDYPGNKGSSARKVKIG